MKALVTGATGKLGSQVMQSLLKKMPADQLAVSVRNPDKANDLKEAGVDVRRGDFDEPKSLDEAFAGVDRLLIISTDGDNDTRIRQHINAVEAAARAGVSFIAYTSIGHAESSTMFLAPPHRAAENAIIETGISYAFLRNNWYLENEVPGIQGAMNGAPWVTAAGNGRVGWALQLDYAEAAAAALAGEGEQQSVYELSGRPYTQDELVDVLGEVLGKEIPVQHVDDDEYAEIMKEAGMPEAVVPMLVSIQQGIRSGSLDIESDDFEKLLGRPATPVHDALEHLVRMLPDES